MTRDEALKVISLISSDSFTRETGMGRTSDESFAKFLNATFPEFHWRIILGRSGHRSRWSLTIDDDDPREKMPEEED
jgi:hypothetical protein